LSVVGGQKCFNAAEKGTSRQTWLCMALKPVFFCDCAIFL